jgi:hypothetical protein
VHRPSLRPLIPLLALLGATLLGAGAALAAQVF